MKFAKETETRGRLHSLEPRTYLTAQVSVVNDAGRCSALETDLRKLGDTWLSSRGGSLISLAENSPSLTAFDVLALTGRGDVAKHSTAAPLPLRRQIPNLDSKHISK